jgi:hypothetical protein
MWLHRSIYRGWAGCCVPRQACKSVFCAAETIKPHCMDGRLTNRNRWVRAGPRLRGANRRTNFLSAHPCTMGLRQSPGSERQFVRMDTWFQANLESPGQSRGASPRTPRSDGEGLFDTFDEDARWDDRAPPSPNVLRRPPTPVAERAAAAPQPQTGSSLLRWGSLLGIVAPQPASAVAGGSGGRGQTSDAVLEHAAVLVQRLIRGKIARLDAAEVTRRFKLLELYVRCTPRLLAPPPPTPHTPRHTPHATHPTPHAPFPPRASRLAPHTLRLLDRRVPRRMPLWSYSAASATGFAAGSRGPR